MNSDNTTSRLPGRTPASPKQPISSVREQTVPEMVPRVLLDYGVRHRSYRAAQRVFTSFTVNRRNCERWKRGFVELQHVILAHSIFLLALTGDIGPPVWFMLKHLKLADENDSTRFFCVGMHYCRRSRNWMKLKIWRDILVRHLIVTVWVFLRRSRQDSR